MRWLHKILIIFVACLCVPCLVHAGERTHTKKQKNLVMYLNPDMQFYVLSFLGIASKESTLFMRYMHMTPEIADRIATWFEHECIKVCSMSYTHLHYISFESMIFQYFGKIPPQMLFADKQREYSKRIGTTRNILLQAFQKKIAHLLNADYPPKDHEFLSSFMRFFEDLDTIIGNCALLSGSHTQLLRNALYSKPHVYAYPVHQTLSEAARTFYIVVRLKNCGQKKVCEQPALFLPHCCKTLLERTEVANRTVNCGVGALLSARLLRLCFGLSCVL